MHAGEAGGEAGGEVHLVRLVSYVLFIFIHALIFFVRYCLDHDNEIQKQRGKVILARSGI